MFSSRTVPLVVARLGSCFRARPAGHVTTRSRTPGKCWVAFRLASGKWVVWRRLSRVTAGGAQPLYGDVWWSSLRVCAAPGQWLGRRRRRRCGAARGRGAVARRRRGRAREGDLLEDRRRQRGARCSGRGRAGARGAREGPVLAPLRLDAAQGESRSIHHTTSHHITSHHITAQHSTSHHITSHHITSHRRVISRLSSSSGSSSRGPLSVTERRHDVAPPRRGNAAPPRCGV